MIYPLIKRWIQFDTGGSLAANQTLATSWITSINTLLGYGGANTKTTVYATNFTYNTNFTRVEVLDSLYPLLSSGDQAKCYEDFANLITLSSPTNSQAYQRNGSNQADIVITGTYAGAASGALEASWNGGAFTTISTGLNAVIPALNVGSFTLTLPAQAMGQGSFIIRPVADPLSAVTKTNVLISDIFLIIGQSNHGEQATNAKTSSGHAVVWNKATRRGRWADMNGTDGTTQAYWPLFASSYATSTGRQCAFIEIAIGGTSISQWQKTSTSIYSDPNNLDSFGVGSNLYARMIAAVAASHCGGVKGAFWHQGEQDSTDGTSQATYQAGLSQLISDINADLGIEVGLAKLQICKFTGGAIINTTPVNTSVANLIAIGSPAWAGPDFTDVTADLDGYGQLHLASDTNVALQASRWWIAAKNKYGYA